MARANQETVTTFGEVLLSATISYPQGRVNTADNRLMIYFQGMKLYIPVLTSKEECNSSKQGCLNTTKKY